MPEIIYPKYYDGRGPWLIDSNCSLLLPTFFFGRQVGKQALLIPAFHFAGKRIYITHPVCPAVPDIYPFPKGRQEGNLTFFL